MHPYETVILVTLALLLIFLLWIQYENYKQRKRIRRKVQRIYGNVPEREYSPGDIENISHYFRRKENQGFYIDDITWNDLDMDKIYGQINQTVSSPGEDVLYDMIRRPLFDQREVDRREKLICFFAENKEKREEMQIMLSKVGKTWHGSLTDTILALENAPEVKTGIHFLMLGILLLNLFVLIPFYPVPGFLLLILLSTGNVIYYYAGNDRARVAAFLDCFSSLLSMLDLAEKIEHVKWPEIQEQMEAVRQGKKALEGLKKRSFFLTSKNEASGDPAQLILDYFRMVFHMDILTYNKTLRIAKDKTKEIMLLIDNIGELDAVISIASFRELLPLWCKPKFTDPEQGHISMQAEDLYHPLIREAVANSIHADSAILVTGSNASGKSTFLKNVAINSILAQTVLTCPCYSYQAPFLKVMTSMALRDDLSGGESYFIVEIRSLKRILDESKKEEPMLCIIDEVLRGTNTIERIAASSRILSALNQNWMLPFAATHDIELSYILDAQYRNLHFEEEVCEHEVLFNYLLKEGRAVSRNAIKLLSMLEYDPEIVREAGEAAADFERTGTWKACGK
ncbi:MutS-related protein [Blautia sp.]|uniref:DNA mismatch repair protein MutS n=1 Tax=Blautia glucerasea TaxID=536633 RepID=A0A6N2S8T9_9FIRM